MVVGQRYLTILCTLAIVAGSAGGALGGEENFDAKAEISALKAEVARLRAKDGDSWLNERRAEEVKSLIREVMSDADTRASLAEGGMTAGHNGKTFFLASEDGGFLMNIEGQIQFRWVYNNRSNDDEQELGDEEGAVDENETGFTIRRAKMNFNGHIADPKLHYEFQIEVDRGDNSVLGDIIVIGYDLTDALTIEVGERKAPFLREEITSSKRQLAAERSLVNELFTLDVVQGIFVDWDATDFLRVSGAFSDGGKSGDSDGSGRVEILDLYSDFDSEASGKDFDDDGTDMALTGRVDWKIAGSWDQYKDFTSWSDEEFFATLGAAVHYEVNETGADNSGPDNDNFFMWTVDGSIEYKGLNLYAAYVMLSTDMDDGNDSDPDDFDPWGLVVQGGYNIDLGNKTSIEPFARYEHLDFDASDDDSSDDSDEIDLVTFGVNWYHKKHAAKFTADVVWCLDPIPSDVSQSGLGILGDPSSESDDQFVVRLQYQLLF